MNRDRLGLLGLVVMLVADVLLIAWIFVGPGGKPIEPRTQPSPTAAAPTPSESASAEAEEPQTRYLATSAGQTLWRATAAECTGPASVVERSDDGGDSWTKVPYKAQVVYRLRFTEPTVGFVVGAKKGCDETVVLSTGDGGKTWQESAAQSTWRALGDTVLVPGGREVEACGDAAVRSLATVDESSALVACADGKVRRTTSGGSAWEDLATVKGVSSVAASGERFAIGFAADGCEGLSVSLGTLSDGAPGEARCVEGAGDATIVIDDGTGWLVGEQVWRSEDLESWEPVA